MFVHPTQDGMDTAVQLFKSARMGKNGMFLNSCASVPATQDGMELSVPLC